MPRKPDPDPNNFSTGMRKSGRDINPYPKKGTTGGRMEGDLIGDGPYGRMGTDSLGDGRRSLDQAMNPPDPRAGRYRRAGEPSGIRDRDGNDIPVEEKERGYKRGGVVRMKGGGAVRGCGMAQRGKGKARFI